MILRDEKRWYNAAALLDPNVINLREKNLNVANFAPIGCVEFRSD
jgi:hypothetical protein